MSDLDSTKSTILIFQLQSLIRFLPIIILGGCLSLCSPVFSVTLISWALPLYGFAFGGIPPLSEVLWVSTPIVWHWSWPLKYCSWGVCWSLSFVCLCVFWVWVLRFVLSTLCLTIRRFMPYLLVETPWSHWHLGFCWFSGFCWVLLSLLGHWLGSTIYFHISFLLIWNSSSQGQPDWHSSPHHSAYTLVV